MSCGGRVYKGDTITISVPFNVEDFTNLTITYTTIGDEKIVLTEEDLEIEDGFITHTFLPGEIDILADGVIYYTVSYEADGVDYLESTNTNLYLKTPAGYSGKTAEDYYQEGYQDGLEDCSGYTPTDCSSAITEAYQSGYTAGVNQERSYLTGITITQNGLYLKALGGYNNILVSVPQSGSSCNLQELSRGIDAEDVGIWIIEPDAGYDGMSRVTIMDNGYGQAKYQKGYAAGQADCTGSSCNLQTDFEIHLEGTETAGVLAFNPDAGYDGISQGYLYYIDAYQRQWSEGQASGFTEGYASGHTDGYTDGWRDGASQHCDLYSLAYVTTTADTDIITLNPQGHAGFSRVSIDMTVYGEGKAEEGWQLGYQSGYADGQQECPPIPSGEIYNIELDEYWDGTQLDILSGELINEIMVTDTGYGQKKYQEGVDDCWVEAYQSGSTDGWQEGYQSGYAEGFDAAGQCDCSYMETIAFNSGYTEGYNSGYTDGQSIGYDNGHYRGYNEGKDSVIKSLMAENDTDLVIGYYYTSAAQVCLLTGEYDNGNVHYDGNSCFVAMSVNGGSWQPMEKYLRLSSGWTQIRFSACTTLLLGAFSHLFTPSRDCYMDALKAISLPNKIDGLTKTYTFHMNDGLRVLSSSCGLVRSATNGADNVNVVISHYKGNQRQYAYFPSNGVFFIPEGSSADWTSVLPNWTHIEMF